MLAKVIESYRQIICRKLLYKNRDPLKLQHSAFYDEKSFRKYLAKGYSYNSTGLSFLKPNVLEQYYGAGNIYMTPTDMGKLITKFNNISYSVLK